MRIVTVSSVLLGLLASTASAESWDMALAYPASNYHTETAAAFAKEIEESTNGELVINLHPNGSLFSGSEIYGAVRRGLAPIGERLISALANEDPLFELDSLPFVATSFQQSRSLYDLSKDTLVKRLEEDGLHFLYSCPWPPQSLYTSAEVTSPDTLKGMKFRAYNNTTTAIAEGLGMVPTKIEAADINQAFATGVADAMISSGSTGFDSKLWEQVDYFYDVKAWLPRNMIVVNQRAWDKLSPETQTAIETAAQNAETSCWAKAEELDGWYLDQFTENGMTVGALPEDTLAAMQAVGAEITEAWKANAGEDAVAVLDAYMAAKQ